MTNNPTLEDLVVRINELQSLVYSSSRHELIKDISPKFIEVSNKIKEMGYVLKRRYYRDYIDGKLYRLCKWIAVTPEKITRNNECEFIYTNNRPKNRPTLKGDCTTRALTYAIGGDYTEIENRQYEIATIRGGLRNQTSNWGRVAEENGFVLVWWIGSVKRSVLGGMVRKNGKVNRPIITISSGHCAVVDIDGSVRDTWDSRGGRVKFLYCHKSDTTTILDLLKRLNPKVKMVK